MDKLIRTIKLAFCWIQNPLFILQISEGKLSTVKGTVKTGFMIDCKEIIERSNVKSGLIYVVKGRYGKSVLKATKDISNETLQQLRNTWNYN